MNGKFLRKTIEYLFLIFFCAKKERLYPAYLSKLNSNPEKQVILLMIPNGEGWHYFAVKKTISIIKRNNVKTPR